MRRRITDHPLYIAALVVSVVLSWAAILWDYLP